MADKRLIDANARIEEIKKAHCTNCDNYGGVRCRACWVDDAIGMIDDAHTVDAAPVVHGMWKAHKPDCRGYACGFICSCCGNITYTDYSMKECEYDYCPNCGAKMDGGSDHVE